jgi:hypothetical protein
MLKPLAIAISSGLVFQLPLALIVLASLLALFRHGPSGALRIIRKAPALVSSDRLTIATSAYTTRSSEAVLRIVLRPASAARQNPELSLSKPLIGLT